ncbi:MAG: magnesium transporter [Thermotogota bacterium]|nr:magnesium transporter [Thermotogota bacterium]
MKVRMEVNVKSFIEHNDLRGLKALLEDQDAATIVEMIDELELEEKVIVFRLLPKELAANVFSELDPREQKKLLSLFKEERVKEIISSMDPDDRTELFDELPANVVKRLLEYLSPQERALAITLLNYPENSAGRIMTPEYVDLKEDMTVAQALDRVRKIGRDKETIYVLFVIDRTRKLVGSLELKDLIFAEHDQKISEIMNSNPLYVHTTDDQEMVAKFMADHDLIAVPVVDSETRLVGVITIDDVVDVLEEETTEDIQRMASLGTTYASYLGTEWYRFFKGRVLWLLVLFVVELLSAAVILHYGDLLQRFMAMAAFIPIMMGIGGSVATQSSALVVRAMSVGEINLKDWWRAVLKETIVGGLIGVVVGLMLFGISHLVIPVWYISLSIGVALFFAVLISSLLGALLPFFARLLKIDPAYMSGPIVTTMVDVLGILIFFGVISRLV